MKLTSQSQTSEGVSSESTSLEKHDGVLGKQGRSLSIRLSNPDIVLSVAVLGTGLYGRALFKRLQDAGSFDVRWGSRAPTGVQVSHVEAVTDASVVLLAVPPDAYKTVVEHLSTYFKSSAVVVDVSNHPLFDPPAQAAPSNAERLDVLLPDSVVVAKAFNTIPAHEIASHHGLTGMSVVHIACDSVDATHCLADMCLKMGFSPSHYGGLNTASGLECHPHRLFPTWQLPVFVTVTVALFWACYMTSWNYLIPKGAGETMQSDWSSYPISMLNTTAASTAMILFSITFLVGPLATMRQLITGSASKPVGPIFGAFLGMRKELGVIGFVLLALHTCIALLYGFPKGKMNIEMSGFYTSGVLGFILFSILVVCSARTVSDHMSWAESRAIFSWVGIASFSLSVLHQTLYVFTSRATARSCEETIVCILTDWNLTPVLQKQCVQKRFQSAKVAVERECLPFLVDRKPSPFPHNTLTTNHLEPFRSISASSPSERGGFNIIINAPHEYNTVLLDNFINIIFPTVIRTIVVEKGIEKTQILI